MTQYQQYQLFCNEPAIIVKIFWTVFHKPKLAILIWLRVTDHCTDDQFIELMRKMLHTYVISSEEDMRLLVDLWNATPLRLKRQITQIPVSSIMKSFFHHRNHSPTSLTFLFEYLSLCSESSRKMAMREISYKLSTHFAHSFRIVDVIKLCYPIDEERAKFLQSVLKMTSTQVHGLSLMYYFEKFDSLSLMLKIVSPNVSANREFVRGLLEFGGTWIDIIVKSRKRKSTEIKFEKWKFVSNYEKWTKLSKFIDETCTSDDNPFWVANIKKRFVSLFASAKDFFSHIYYLDELAKVLEEVFTHEEAHVFRNTLLDTFRIEVSTQLRYWKIHNARNFVEFVIWCLGDVRKLEEFRLTLIRDNTRISESMFRSTLLSLPEINLYEYFETLNKCLRFFWSVDEANKFKKQKIHEFNNKIVLGVLLEPADENTSIMENNLGLILQHVFGNDVEEMKRWRRWKRDILDKYKFPENRYEPVCLDYVPKFLYCDFDNNGCENCDECDYFDDRFFNGFDDEIDFPYLTSY
ncbi:hypothetical protein U1Q18_051193 [Sarracenia purpurea var. burkii]